MTKLARLKEEGRIEVLRERNANYPGLVFVDGKRPSDELITASLAEGGTSRNEATDEASNHIANSKKDEDEFQSKETPNPLSTQITRKRQKGFF